MTKDLIIVAVTEMEEPYVCVSGYDPATRRYVRPVLPGRLPRSWLFVGPTLVIQPWAVVRLRFREHRPDPPHIEDWVVDPDTPPEFLRWLEADERPNFLTRTVEPSVEAILGVPVTERILPVGVGKRTLGTIQAASVEGVRLFMQDDRLRYRLAFTDATETALEVTVSDLTFRRFCEAQIEEGRSPDEVAGRLTEQFQANDTYIHIGLTRPYVRPGETEAHLYLQACALYTLPHDYLEGRTLLSFARGAEAPQPVLQTPPVPPRRPREPGCLLGWMGLLVGAKG